MSDEEIKRLNKLIEDLQTELKTKQLEVAVYRKELLKFSQKLDEVISDTNDDVRILHHIQKVLAPTEMPQFPGFEFSRKFVYGSKSGGDYFDIFEHEDKFKFGVILSSSSGYAMSALFLSLVLKVSHLMEARKGMPPEKVMEHIGEELKKSASEKDQTQAFYGVIDRRDLSLTFCAVGRIRGYVQIPNQPLQVLSTDSPALSPMNKSVYKSIRIELEPKTKLCFVTEGLLDVLPSEEIAHYIQTHAQFSVHELRNGLLLQAQLKSGLETPLRDQTVVVMEVKDRVIKLAK